MKPLLLCSLIFVGATNLLALPSAAGVFTLTQYMNPGKWNLGIEPELQISNGSGFAVNTKFTYGLNSLSNVQIGIGPGSGDRQFRFGGAYTFDFIPDIDGQVGAGIALQTYFFKLNTDKTETTITAIPYLHKSFNLSNGTGVDPYLSFPFGMAFVDGRYRSTAQFVMGSFMKLTPQFSYSIELGLNMGNSDSYLAGGVTYFH